MKIKYDAWVCDGDCYGPDWVPCVLIVPHEYTCSGDKMSTAPYKCYKGRPDKVNWKYSPSIKAAVNEIRNRANVNQQLKARNRSYINAVVPTAAI